MTGTIIVTGGASGIGEACARRLAADGERVIVADVNEPRGLTVADEIGGGAAFRNLDVRDEAAWRRLMDDVGPIHGLVNAAGVADENDTLAGCTRAVWDRVMSINADGTFLGCKLGVERLKTSGGAIVNIASMYANVGDPGSVAYCASKGVVWLLTKSVARHCAANRYPVRINAVHPGYILTQMFEPYIARDPALVERLGAATPLGRIGKPGEVAALVAFLLSDDARFVNGASLVPDGGYMAA